VKSPDHPAYRQAVEDKDDRAGMPSKVLPSGGSKFLRGISANFYGRMRRCEKTFLRQGGRAKVKVFLFFPPLCQRRMSLPAGRQGEIL